MRRFSLLFGIVGSLVIGAGWMSLAVAEVVPDATLPQPSRVNRSGRTTAITAGTRRGRNLFHSFREFSVDSGETASFRALDPGIENIFARITGRNLSRIDGTLEALQADGRISSANLFLINPNGIIFGRHAILRLGGSLIATTADRVNFADGSQFSAVRPQASPLLTVSVPTGLQFGRNPGPIVNRAATPLLNQAGNPIVDALGYDVSGLMGGTNQTFALVGNGITFNSGKVLVDSGRIEIGSVGSNSQVTLTPIASGWDFGYENVENFADVRLLGGGALIDGTGSVGSTIQIQSRQLVLQDLSVIFSASANANQPGGAIEITTTDSIVAEQRSRISTETYGFGRGGNIIVSTPRLNILTGGQVGSFTYSAGQGGDVRITAPRSITVADLALEVDSSSPVSPLSLIYAQTDGPGNSGNVSLETDQLQVRSGGQISTNTLGTGDAGNLKLRADQVELTGIALSADGRPLFSNGLIIPGGLFTGTNRGSSGNGGRLTIETRQLSLRDGAILQATTYGSGDAGRINIQATDAIEVSGTSEPGNLPARIAATSGGIQEFSTRRSRQATGRGGNLNITTDTLTIEDGGIVTVNSLNPQAIGAGTIRIEANRISLDNRGQLNAQTESGDDAGIRLEGVDLLTLRRNSNISTSAGLLSNGGDGGDINIDANLILDAPAENSDINADAGKGSGGRIDIAAQGILGIAERDQRTLQSDITATSESGVDGEINISTPTVDPTRGIVELPNTIVDASQLIAQGCRAGSRVADELGEFVITGRGGLPPSPTDLRSAEAVVADWARLEPQENRTENQQVWPGQNPVPVARAAADNRQSHRVPAESEAIVEAQGWVVGRNGQISLVAQAPGVTPHPPNWILPSCVSQDQSPQQQN